jgi:glycosyltransferase involved in cell wall biosynthesis
LKILAFCFFPSFVPPSNGGQSRLFHFYRALSKRHEVTLLTSTHIGVDDEIIQHGTDFIERRIPKDDYFVQEYARLDPFSSGGDLSGPALAACGKFPTRLHQAYLDEYEKADLILHDFPFTAEYDVFRGLDKKPRVYNAHNCESQLYAQLHPAERSKPIHDLVHQAETNILSFADLVLYCNEDDLHAFRKISPDADFAALYAPNGMQTLAGTNPAVGPSPRRLRTVFMGSGHPPNAHAADFIARQLAPQLPNIDFDIIGSCLPEGLYPSNLHRHGVVSEGVKQQILAAANLALNPMAAGSGSNVKVLDYFSHGLPLLSTSFGMRGIEAKANKDYIEAGLDQFAHALRSAAEHPQSLAAIAQNGKVLALANYTWDAIVGKAALAMEELVASKAKIVKQYVLALNDYDSFAGIGGGGTRTRGLYTAVSEWCPVVFLSFADDGRLQSRRHANNITVINVPKTRAHLTDQNSVNAQYHVSADDIIAGQHCRHNPYFSIIYRTLRQSARCIVIEHCYMVSLPMSWGDRFVYSSQNHEAELKRRLLKGHPVKDTLVGYAEFFERHAVEGSAATIAVSLEDAESLVKGKRSSGPVIVVRNGAAVPAQGESVALAKAKLSGLMGNRSVVFLGSAHMPNVEAAQFISEQLAQQCHTVQFHILGSVCSAITKVPRNVKLWGVVDDETKSAVMQSCALAINPMLSGSGSNVKLADYIGNGLHVVTTEFGQRGYPASAQAHLSIASIDGFATALEQTLANPTVQLPAVRMERVSLFQRELSMVGLATRFVQTLKSLETKKKRVLYVTYRYVSPAMGGAEVNLEKFLGALGHSGQFDVDVISPEVSAIQNLWRFSEHYSFDQTQSAPVDIPNLRFAHFPVDASTELETISRLREIWQAQPKFERAVSEQLMSHYTECGLAWGWGYCEGTADLASRWAFADCGIHLQAPARVMIEGYTPNEAVITVFSEHAMVDGPRQFNGRFKFEFDAPAGAVVFETSTKIHASDPRPLGFHVSRILIGGQPIDLTKTILYQRYLSTEPAASAFHILDKAAEATRTRHKAHLTDSRGPWSAGMERFIADHVAEYDLVIANNNVFRPAVVAMAEAKRHGVASILIPHAHLDDDFYHFPDWLQCARDATLVLAAPKAACDFLAEKACNVRYLPAGCDTQEIFTAQDVDAFKRVYSDERPFILVLGRKAGAKGYKKIIDAVEQLNRDGISLNAVLMGPDDDGLPICSPHACYLGRQPREVVRGALQSCLALCNMSSSESFGIVLLEAWLAGKPVIANKNCAAFHDMAIHDDNALLVTDETLALAIGSVVNNPGLRESLAKNGRRVVSKFDWRQVCREFVDICTDLTTPQKTKP